MIQAGNVELRAEHSDVVVCRIGGMQRRVGGRLLVCLEALEDLHGVMKDGGGRRERDGTVRFELRGGPAVLLAPLHGKHLICEDGAPGEVALFDASHDGGDLGGGRHGGQLADVGQRGHRAAELAAEHDAHGRYLYGSNRAIKRYATDAVLAVARRQKRGGAEACTRGTLWGWVVTKASERGTGIYIHGGQGEAKHSRGFWDSRVGTRGWRAD